jgi:hypothetical protein
VFTETAYLTRPDGRVAYDVAGDGPLLVLLPGMGEARLNDVSAPTLVVMGEQDPDFPDPRAEAEWIGQALNGDARTPTAARPQPFQPLTLLA